MRDENCIFCKIAAGEIPAATLYEDEDFRVILDLNPASKGHALILPKEHYRNLYDLDDKLAAKVLVLAKKMTGKMRDVLKCDGNKNEQNKEESAEHSDLQLPFQMKTRYKGDNVGLGWRMGTLTDEDREEIVKKME